MANRAYLYNAEQSLLSPEFLHDAAAQGLGRWIEVADWARAVPAPWMLAFRRANATPYAYRSVETPGDGPDRVTYTGQMLNTSRDQAQRNLRDAWPLIEMMVGDPRRARRYLDAALAAFATLELPVVALYADELVDGDDEAFLGALEGTPASIPALQRWSAGFDCGFGPVPYVEDEDDDKEEQDGQRTGEPGDEQARRAREYASRSKPALAMACLKQAAKAGHAGSAYSLGLVFQGPRPDVEGVEEYLDPLEQVPDFEKSRYWLRQAVDAGLNEPLAFLILGEMAFNGVPGPQDHDAALRWFRLAANAGSTKAQLWMAIACYHGYGMKEPDLVAAADWARRVALQGEAIGQFALGLLYYQGHGVPKDPVEWRKCMENAAGQGYEPAIRFLATPSWKFWERRGFFTGLS